MVGVEEEVEMRQVQMKMVVRSVMQGYIWDKKMKEWGKMESAEQKLTCNPNAQRGEWHELYDPYGYQC